MPAGVGKPGGMGDSRPCLEVAVKVADSNDALRMLGEGGSGKDRHKRRKRQGGDTDDPLEAGPDQPPPHRRHCCTAEAARQCC